MRGRCKLLAALLVGLTAPAAVAQAPAVDPASATASQGAQLDLTRAFHTRSDWRLVITEGPPTQDYGGNDAPGALTLCLREGASGPCVCGPVTPPLILPAASDPAWEPHYLRSAKAVYPHGLQAPPLLLIVTGSPHSGDGG